MIRGTTPTITMKLPSNVVVDNIATAMVSIQQVGRKDKIDKKYDKENPSNNSDEAIGIDTATNCIWVKLTQEDTLSLFAGKTTKLQLKVKMDDGTVTATSPMPLAVVETINEEVI